LILLDTHVLVWWLAEPRRLTTAARRAIGAAARSNEVVVSAASFFEISTLLRRGRLELDVDSETWLGAVRSLPELGVEPVTAEIAWLAGTFDAGFPGDPADRIIAATARTLETKLVTADKKLLGSNAVDTVW
jgi:PIN domain nuclease of toxin-antitoxin system